MKVQTTRRPWLIAYKEVDQAGLHRVKKTILYPPVALNTLPLWCFARFTREATQRCFIGAPSVYHLSLMQR
jgi:hypothetical protein